MSTLQPVETLDLAEADASEEDAALQIYRITRVAPDRWVVERSHASIEHAFATLEEAVASVRRECLYKPATVELRVDDLYVVAQLDPNRPCSLFGEAPS